MAAFSGSAGQPWFLLLLAALKLLATCLSLGSGASGGVFSPALFMGAAAGSRDPDTRRAADVVGVVTLAALARLLKTNEELS